MHVASLTEKTLADTIDYAYLKANGTTRDIEQHCAEAIQYQFAMVAVNPAETAVSVALTMEATSSVGVMGVGVTGNVVLTVQKIVDKANVQIKIHLRI